MMYHRVAAKLKRASGIFNWNVNRTTECSKSQSRNATWLRLKNETTPTNGNRYSLRTYRGISTCSQRRQLLVNEGIVRSPFPAVDIDTNTNLPHYIIDRLNIFGNSPALVDGVTGRKVTYSQLSTDVIKVASALSRLGLTKGQIVTMFAPNSIEWAIFYLAASATGAVVSAVNPLYTAGELAHTLNHSATKIIISTPELMTTVKAACGQCSDIKHIIVFGESDGCIPFSKLLEDDGKAFPDNVDIDPLEDMMALLYSSGTTGLPKGVMLTHTNIIANLQQASDPLMLEHRPDDVLIGVLPFFHIYGQMVILLSGLQSGAMIVIMPKFDPELFLKNIAVHKCTFLHVVSPMALFLAKEPIVSNFDMSSVRGLFVGAAPTGPETIAEVIRRIGGHPSFQQGYGLTETSPLTHINPRYAAKLHTVGQAIPNTEFKVLDLESGIPLPIGKEGEVCIRGPQVMKGYFKNQKATDDTIKDGWLHTGDIGYYDEDGHLIISDRLKELIKFKGFQVAPAELEALLVTHPAIQDAAVIGKPDENAGELPRAYVVLKPNMKATEEDVRTFVKENMAPFKQLSGGVEFRSEIPRSASGKILRRILKDELKQKA